MSFAQRYIKQQISLAPFIKKAPDNDLSIIVVIPAYNETNICQTLNSLAACCPIKKGIELIVVVNESEHSEQAVIEQNKQTVAELTHWQSNNPTSFLNLHAIHPPAFKHKHRGVGSARKAGMDEAIRRFNAINNPAGIIVSLDADTLVAENYFLEIAKLFSANKNLVACTINFEHRIVELDNAKQIAGMQIYEQYLHYFKRALEYTGYPHAIYTIGSAFACRAEAYVKQGGMPRRQAGEDFYFLHKLTAMGKIAELESTTVYPSARLSDRVPFGTGPSLQAWMDGDDRINSTYNFKTFVALRSFFSSLTKLYQQEDFDINDEALASFLAKEQFADEVLPTLISNSATYDSFEKRFYQYFNAFKIIKYLNFAHEEHYQKEPLSSAYMKLMSKL